MGGTNVVPINRNHSKKWVIIRVFILLSTLILSIIPSPYQEKNTVLAEELAAPLLLGDSLSVQYIGAGYYHSCGIKTDGSVICWGDNTYGQLDVPASNSGFTQISVGVFHTCGLKSDGSLVCWGEASNGKTNIPAPNSSFTQVSAGSNHTCGLKNDNSLVCWGDNTFKQTTIPTPNNFYTQVSAGGRHTCGLKNDGRIICWGDNPHDVLVVPTPNDHFIQVDAGGMHNCGLKDDGSLTCWGWNLDGQTTIPSPNSGYKAVSAGYYHTCARKSDNTILCWGDNSDGQTSVPTPNSGFAQLSAGANHTCGLKGDGSYVCWGDDLNGQTKPNQFVDISAGMNHTCGINKSLTVICWGKDAYGSLTVPYPNTDFIDVSAGWGRTCGVKIGGSIVCWGGYPLINYGTIPTPNTGYSDLSVGDVHACAAKGNDLYCWPEDTFVFAPPSPSAGYLFNTAGDDVTCGTTTSYTVDCWGMSDPSPNTGLYNISAGNDHSCAIKSDSSIQCWGSNAFGKATVPAPNSNFDQEISVGMDHSCSRKLWNSVVCWGSNANGQSSVPSPNNYWKMDAGYYHTCALRPNGTPVCWGRNTDGQTDLPYPSSLKVPPSLYPPSAVDDSYSTLEDTPLSENFASGVLVNDTDFDGPALTAYKDSDPSQGTAALALDGSFLYTPTGDSCGPDSYTYHAEDGTFSSNTATVNLTVTCVNDPPSFSASNPPAINEDEALQTIPGWASFTSPGPADEAAQTVQSYIISNISNPGLFSQAPAVSATGTLTYQLAPDQNGSPTFDVQVRDNGGTADGGVDTSAAQTFTITVNPINDQPDFSASDPPAVSEDAGLQSIPSWATFDPGHSNESSQSVLAYTVSNISNPSLFSTVPAVSPAGTLTYQSAANQNGSSTFDVHVQDDGGTASGGIDTGPDHTFTIQVNPENDPPTTPGLGAFNIVEGTPGNLMDIWPNFDDLEDTDLQLSFSLESYTNPGLFFLIDIYQDQYLRMAYTPDEFGSSTITVRATDTGGLFVDSDLVLTLRPVNDAPSFTPGGNVNVPMNSGAYSAPWAGDISSGPANESGQTLTFTISNANNGLFAVQPDLTLAGILSFTPSAGVTGSAQVSVTLSDDGGTTDGGVDTSPTETFTISVGPFPTVTMVRAEGGPGIFPGATVVDWIDDFSIQFDMPLDNPPGNTNPDDATNPANYLLVFTGPNGILETTSCIGAPGGDDRLITVNAVSYPYLGNYALIFINGGISIPSGEYRLFACGSTSLTAGGVALGGDGVNPGTDYSLDFYVKRPDRLPDTGFPPGKVTLLDRENYLDLAANSTGLTLEIPRLDLSAPITGIPLQENDWNVRWLSSQVGWLEGTAFPTWAGNSVLTAHNINRNGLPGPFNDLKSLRYGDQIVVNSWGQSYIYEVRSIKTLLADDLSTALGHEEYPWITLVTCSGYLPYQEIYSARIVVKAVQVGIK